MQTHEFTVSLSQIQITTWAQDSDTAVNMVLEAEKAPFEAFVSVYQANPVPKVSSKYGAPHGRMSRPLDHNNLEDGLWKAEPVPIDEDGCDLGGAYWGLRPTGQQIFSVQDGMGNIAFVDAVGPEAALMHAAAA